MQGGNGGPARHGVCACAGGMGCGRTPTARANEDEEVRRWTWLLSGWMNAVPRPLVRDWFGHGRDMTAHRKGLDMTADVRHTPVLLRPEDPKTRRPEDPKSVMTAPCAQGRTFPYQAPEFPPPGVRRRSNAGRMRLWGHAVHEGDTDGDAARGRRGKWRRDGHHDRLQRRGASKVFNYKLDNIMRIFDKPSAGHLAGAVRRFLASASLAFLVILGLHGTVYGQDEVNGGVRSVLQNEASATPRLGICDRTKQVRDAIVAKIAGVGNCTQVTDAHMAKIKGPLRLENTQISSLQAGDFAGLPNLRVIHLHGNRLSSLPPDVFDGLSSLEELELYGNQLSTLPSNVFDGLSSLFWLDLSANRLSSLPSDVFDGLSSLEWLILWENRLSSLPPDVFGGLSSLTKLNLRANRLSILPSDVFGGLSSLEMLNLQHNRLSSLPDGVFEGLSSLEELFLRENQLNSLPSNVFDGLSSLTRLDLRANRLSSLPSDVFDGLSSLEGLLLDRNQLTLTGLPSDVFDGLSSLEMLNLQHNRLSSLPDGVFEGLSSLEWLLLYENPVDPMPLTVSLEKVGDSGFKATVLAGAPFTMTFPVGVTNGNIVGEATTLTIPAGAVESGTLSVTRAVGTTDAVTVDIDAPLPRLPEAYHQGYALAKATDLPRVILADDETPRTSAAPAPVWPAPANPPLAEGEEELLTATVILGSHPFPLWVAGYGRVLGESFGAMDVTAFEDGGTTYVIEAFLVNARGVFALATGATLPDASGLVAYWNGYRIAGLEVSYGEAAAGCRC